MRSAAEPASKRRAWIRSRCRLWSAKARSASSRRAATSAEQSLGLVALRAGGEGTRLRLGERGPCRARSVGSQRHPGLERLALDPLVQLGGLRLALQRAQP